MELHKTHDQLRTGMTAVCLTSSGKRRCERLPPALSDASRSSGVCKVPSSRSRLHSRSAREAAQPKAKFFCKAQTRSPVGADPFPWHEQHGHRSLNEPNFLGSGRKWGRRESKMVQTAAGRLDGTRILLAKGANTHNKRCRHRSFCKTVKYVYITLKKNSSS